MKSINSCMWCYWIRYSLYDVHNCLIHPIGRESIHFEKITRLRCSYSSEMGSVPIFEIAIVIPILSIEENVNHQHNSNRNS